MSVTPRPFEPRRRLLFAVALAVFGALPSAASAAPATWQRETPLPRPFVSPAFAALGGQIYIVGGVDSVTSTGTRAVVAYNPTARAWTARASLPELRVGATAAGADGRLYVVGGDGPSQNATSSLYIYSPNHNRWSAGPPAPSVSYHSPAVVMRNAAGHAAIYLFVGHGEVIPSSGGGYAVYKTFTYSYDTVTGSWSQLATSPGGMANGGAAGVIGGLVYVNMLTRTTPSSGGACVNAPDDSTVGAYQDCIWTYDPGSDTWTAVAAGAQPYGTTQFGASTADGKLAVVGEGPLSLSGPVDHRSVEVYDPVQNGWSYAPDTIAQHDQGAIVRLGTRLYAIGGRNEVTSVNTRVAESIDTTS